MLFNSITGTLFWINWYSFGSLDVLITSLKLDKFSLKTIQTIAGIWQVSHCDRRQQWVFFFCFLLEISMLPHAKTKFNHKKLKCLYDIQINQKAFDRSSFKTLQNLNWFFTHRLIINIPINYSFKFSFRKLFFCLIKAKSDKDILTTLPLISILSGKKVGPAQDFYKFA